MADSKVILVTGASAGIGAAVAQRLADQGHRVYGTTRRLESLKGSPAGEKVRFVELDVDQTASVQRCVAQVLAEAGRIDVLINNAGWGTYGAIEELPIETGQALFNTIVWGALRMIQTIVPAMRERREGLIINITSIAAEAVIPFQSHYSAAKAALRAFTIGLRQEMKPFRVGVTMVEPSDINTRFNDVTVFGKPDISPYKPWSDPCWKVIETNLPKAPPPGVIAKTVARIVARRRQPKTIYTSGIVLQRMTPTLFRFFPYCLQNKALRMFYGVKG